MEVFRWIWQYCRKYKFLLTVGFFLVTCTSALSMVSPYVAGIIVDRVVIAGEKAILPTMLGIMVGAILIRSIIRYLFQIIFETISQGVVFTIRKKIYSKIQELDFSYFDRTRTGDIMARITGDIEAVRHFLAWVVYGIFESIILLVFALVMFFSTNVTLAIALIAVTPFTAFFTFKLARNVKPAFTAIREQFSKLNTVTQENISGNRVVKAFSREDYETLKFTKENEAFREKNLTASWIWAKYLTVLDSLAGVMSVVMILIGGILVINGSLSMGGLVTFNGFIWALNNPFRMSGWLVNDVQRFAASADKIIVILNTSPRITDTEIPADKQKLAGAVEFKDVSFSYGEGEILKHISISVEPGRTVAFVGPTGSGKSTLVSLISRFYEACSGKILIDGIDIHEINIEVLRKNIGVAMQDIFLFSDTIEGNIAYGRPEATIGEVRRAAEAAGAHEFISVLPEGYDTIIGERGVGLSGGQKQRIALARALLTDPAILILDDTTSSVDVETEKKIHEALGGFFKGRTTFIIAHRISSVRDSDMIYVLDEGEIVEQGSHAELLEKKGYYYRIHINQSGEFNIRKSDDSGDYREIDCGTVVIGEEGVMVGQE